MLASVGSVKSARYFCASASLWFGSVVPYTRLTIWPATCGRALLAGYFLRNPSAAANFALVSLAASTALAALASASGTLIVEVLSCQGNTLAVIEVLNARTREHNRIACERRDLVFIFPPLSESFLEGFPSPDNASRICFRASMGCRVQSKLLVCFTLGCRST